MKDAARTAPEASLQTDADNRKYRSTLFNGSLCSIRRSGGCNRDINPLRRDSKIVDSAYCELGFQPSHQVDVRGLINRNRSSEAGAPKKNVLLFWMGYFVSFRGFLVLLTTSEPRAADSTALAMSRSE
jgi:hypothetical protein